MLKAVVVGASEVGTSVCQTLSERGYGVTLIEQDSHKAGLMEDAFNGRVMRGDGSRPVLLNEADMTRVDLFLAMTNDDKTNIIACSVAKSLGATYTIARVSDQTYEDNSLINYQLHFGVDSLMNPEALCALELSKAIRVQDNLFIAHFARGEIEVQQVRMSARSKYIGKALKDIRMDKEVRIGFVKKDNELIVPRATLKLEENDEITLFGSSKKLWSVCSAIDPHKSPDVKKVTLFGGGETAIALTRSLMGPGFKIRIIERDHQRCQELAALFPSINIIHGDATSLRLLEEEQIQTTDYFIACTKDDEDNIMTCLQVATLGVEHVMLVITRPDYATILKRQSSTLGVEHVVSPRVATTNELSHYLPSEHYKELLTLSESGNIKVLEILIPLDSPISGMRLKELVLPEGTLIMTLMHKFSPKVPGAEDKIIGGDRIVVITSVSDIASLMKQFVG